MSENKIPKTLITTSPDQFIDKQSNSQGWSLDSIAHEHAQTELTMPAFDFPLAQEGDQPTLKSVFGSDEALVIDNIFGDSTTHH